MRPAPLAPFRRLAIVALASTLVLVALGGAVRATDSGLACPTWPGCFSAGDFVPGLQLNVWLEHSHRLLAGLVALQLGALLVWAVARHRHRRAILVPAVVAAVAVNVQAALGALVVLHLLRAELVTAHLGMAMLIIACLAYLVVRASGVEERNGCRAQADRRFAWLASAVAALCFLQILIGGHVTGINAGLVFTDFPLMGGAIFPPITTDREAFHVAHRLVAYLLAGGIVLLVARAVGRRRELVRAGTWGAPHRWLVRLPVWAAVLVVLQVGLGVANLRNGTSFLTVIPHLAVASWLWTLLIFLAILAHRAPVPVEDPAAPADVLRPTSEASLA